MKTRFWTKERAALTAFAVCLLAGGALILFHLGRYRWFVGDDWEFVASRRADDVHDLFRPHGGLTTWFEVRSGPNGRMCVVEPIGAVLDLIAANLAERR